MATAHVTLTCCIQALSRQEGHHLVPVAVQQRVAMCVVVVVAGRPTPGTPGQGAEGQQSLRAGAWWIAWARTEGRDWPKLELGWTLVLMMAHPIVLHAQAAGLQSRLTGLSSRTDPRQNNS